MQHGMGEEGESFQGNPRCAPRLPLPPWRFAGSATLLQGMWGFFPPENSKFTDN